MRLSFRGKLILFVALLLCVMQATDFLSVYTSTRELAFSQAHKQLTTAAQVFHRQFQDLTDQLVQQVRALTLDFGFRETIAVGDERTQRSAIENLGKRVAADRLMLVSLDAEIIIDTAGVALEGEPFPFEDLLEEAEAEGQAAGIVEFDGRVYRIVFVPVLAPVPVAWIGIATQISDPLAQRISEFAALPLQLTFAFKSAQGWRVVGSNGGDAIRRFVAENSGRIAGMQDRSDVFVVDGETFAVLGTALQPTGATPVHAVLQYSVQDAINQTRPLLSSIVILLVVGLAIALIGGYFIARGISRPLNALVAAIGRIRQADYSEPIAFTENNEFGDLSSTFNTMMDEIRQREAKITHQATHDDLTDLPNRSEFVRSIERETARLDEDGAFAVVVIGIGRLKDVRESLGYGMGDRLIRQVCDAFARSLPDSSILARIDGDKLAIAFAGRDTAQCLERIDRLTQTQTEPLSLGEFLLVTGLKFGTAFYRDHGSDAETLVRRAEIAMHKAIGIGAAAHVFSPDSDEVDPERLLLIGELREAIRNGQLVLFYQPKIDIARNCVVGAEGLVRWRHPERGLIPPDVFIPLAEQTGDIRAITEWSLNRAMQDQQRWRDLGVDLKISVNLTVYDLIDHALPQMLRDMLAETGTEPQSIVLEITESGLMADPDLAGGLLRDLAEGGFGLSIDDYGTGYSAMGYLKTLPVSELKIDRSFVTALAVDSTDAVIVASTTEMAHNLGLTVTAEGVEDRDTYAALKAHGCDLAQGYYFSRPLPFEEFNEFLRTSDWGTNGQGGDFVKAS